MPENVHSPVPWLQDRAEFNELLRCFLQLAPRRVLEIGSLYGGTLWQWMDNMQPGGLVVSVDLILPASDKRYGEVIHAQTFWKDWAEEYKTQLVTIHADSTEPAMVEAIRAHAPFDFIFVDGGHERNTVKADFLNYFPMLRKGGIIAIHDIIQEGQGMGVKSFWRVLKAVYNSNTSEILHTYGIGMVTK